MHCPFSKESGTKEHSYDKTDFIGFVPTEEGEPVERKSVFDGLDDNNLPFWFRHGREVYLGSYRFGQDSSGYGLEKGSYAPLRIFSLAFSWLRIVVNIAVT